MTDTKIRPAHPIRTEQPSDLFLGLTIAIGLSMTLWGSIAAGILLIG